MPLADGAKRQLESVAEVDRALLAEAMLVEEGQLRAEPRATADDQRHVDEPRADDDEPALESPAEDEWSHDPADPAPPPCPRADSH